MSLLLDICNLLRTALWRKPCGSDLDLTRRGSCVVTSRVSASKSTRGMRQTVTAFDGHTTIGSMSEITADEHHRTAAYKC